MGILGNLLSCIKKAHPQFDFKVGTWDCSRGAAGERVSSHLEGEFRGFSPVAVGSFGFLSRCVWKFMEHLILLRKVMSPSSFESLVVIPLELL